MEADLAQFKSQNTEVIAVAVQDIAGAQTSVHDTNATFPILADPDHTIADQYGVFNLLGDSVATPSVFVINQTGQIVWSYVGENINDRPTNQEILSNLPLAL